MKKILGKKIVQNSLWVSGSQIIGRGIGFAYFIILARMFSVAKFGLLAWVLGFVYNFYPLADFGIERLVLKEIARKPDKRNYYLSRLIPLRLILAAASVVAALSLSLLIGVRGNKLFLVLLFSLSMLPYNLVFLFASFENAAEKMTTFAQSVVFTSLASFLIGLTFALLGLGLGGVLFGYFLANMLVLIWLLSGKRQTKFNISWQFDFYFWQKILAQSWVFAIFSILGVFYLRSPLILIGQILGDYDSGIYGAASKFAEAGILIPQGIAIALFPKFSKAIAKKDKNIKQKYLKSLKLLLLFSIPICLIMVFGAKWIMMLIYGPDYLPSAKVFAAFGPVMILFFLNSIAGNVIQNSKQVKKFIPFALANLAVAISAGLILIPKLGPVGGVLALLFGEIFGLVVNNWFAFCVLDFTNKKG